MKIIKKKALFYILVSPFFNSCLTQAATSSWYEKVKKIIHVLHHALTHKETELDELLSGITKQFNEFETWMIAQEQKALNVIKEKYGMSDEIWQKCLLNIDNIKKKHAASLLQSNPEITHDADFPEDIKEMFLMLIKHNNINPKSIHLRMADEVKFKAKPHTIAETIISVEITTKNNVLEFDLPDTPTQITIFPRLTKASYEKKLTTCAHELQHVISQHGITESILLAYLAHYCHIDEAAFKKTGEYQKLCQIHEAQAEILAAITHADTAHHMKIYRENNHYPGYLYEEHFYCLSTIDTLWKLRQKLMALYS